MKVLVIRGDGYEQVRPTGNDRKEELLKLELEEVVLTARIVLLKAVYDDLERDNWRY